VERYTDTVEGRAPRVEAARKVARAAAAVVGLLLLAYAISILVVRLDVYFAVLAGVAGAAALVLTVRFELGILMYLLVAPFITGQSPSVLGPEASSSAGVMPSEAGLVFLCLLWAASQAFGRGIRLVRTRLNLPILVFFIVAASSMAVAAYTWDLSVERQSKQSLYELTEVGLWLLCPAAFFLAANGIRRREWLPALFWPVVTLGLYAAACQVAGVEMPLRVVRSGFLIAFAIVMTAARLLIGKEKPAAKVGLALLLVVLFASALWDRTWVSGWGAAILGFMLVVIFHSRRLFAALAVIILFVTFVYPGFYYSIYYQSAEEGDLDRLAMWRDSVNMAVRTNPVLGIGPASYVAYSKQYASVWHGRGTYSTAHSDYAQMIAELGALGLAAFLWLVAAGVATGLDAIRRTRSDIRWLAVGATAVFASIAVTSLIGDYLLPSRVNGGIWSFGTSVFPWLLLGGAVAAREEEPAPVES